jgi:hypothetical protein
MSTAVAIPSKQYEEKRLALQSVVDSLIVTDAPTCLEAKKAQQDIRIEIKMRKSVLDPFVLIEKKSYDAAKDERAKWIEPMEAMDAVLAEKVKGYERREREKAEAEQRRINEENRIKAQQQAEAERKERERIAAEERKRLEKELADARKAGEISKRELEKAQREAREAEAREKARAAEDARMAAENVPQVEVKANIPTVQGVPSRRNYKARVIDASRVPKQFWVIDQQSLDAEARKAKKVGEFIPGVLFEEV